MEWYQHPDGQIPAYEWDFSNINPPVHAWAAWQVYDTEREIYGVGDTEFLDRVFAKLGQNFTWWVNEVDAQDNNIFEGGFLGMDNIRIIDRDAEGHPIEQADGSAWMAMFCLNMLRISLELAELHGGADDERAYRYNDAARKYLQHFMYICDAMNRIGTNGAVGRRAGLLHGLRQPFRSPAGVLHGGPRPALRRRGGPPAGAEPGLLLRAVRLPALVRA